MINRKQQQLIKTLKSESGASLIFILGIMMLLLAIGASTLAAASASVGTGINRHVAGKLSLYAESVQKSVMFSLQENGDDVGRRVDGGYAAPAPETLGGQLIKALYLNEDGVHDLPTELSAGLDGDDRTLVNIKLTYENVEVDIIPYEPAIDITPDDPDTPFDEYAPAVPEQPKSASISADITFVITAEEADKKAVHAVTCRLSGALIMMGADSAGSVMEIADAGVWRIISYDRI